MLPGETSRGVKLLGIELAHYFQLLIGRRLGHAEDWPRNPGEGNPVLS